MGRVRCQKISAGNYEQIQEKDENILYFVNDTGTFGPQSMENSGTIYLGDKILSQSINGMGYGYCSTNQSASGSTMVVSLPGYEINNGFVSVRFRYSVPASALMNVNSKGPYAIYLGNSALPVNIIKSDDIAIFFFDGTYYNLVSVYNKDAINYAIQNLSNQLYDEYFVTSRDEVITSGNDAYLLLTGQNEIITYDKLINGTQINIDFTQLQGGVSDLISVGLTDFNIKFQDTSDAMLFIDDGTGSAMSMSNLIGVKSVSATYCSPNDCFYISSIVRGVTDSATSGSKDLITSGGVYTILGDIETLLAAI